MAKRTRSLAQASACAAKLKVVADPTRLAVLEALMTGPRQVGALQQLLGVEQSLLSHHLQTLRKAGLVDTERDGKAVLYRLATKSVAEAGEQAINLGCCLISVD
jgi:DNA-binding transcriptional ArsR family regulator